MSLATQKQALSALVFFFKDVCGMEEVLALVERLTETWKLAALLQYAAGLRRSEVMTADQGRRPGEAHDHRSRGQGRQG